MRAWWAHHFPGWEIILEDSEGEDWCKPRALNRAVARASGRTLVLADADSFCDPGVLLQAVREVWAHNAWVMPHRRVLRLNEAETRRVLARDHDAAPGDEGLVRPAYLGTVGGGIVVLKREAWDGHDERFLGWGADDDALGIRLRGMLGRERRLDADLYHLWHPQAPRDELAANRHLLAREYRPRPAAPRVRVIPPRL
jgi:hypothetical protein